MEDKEMIIWLASYPRSGNTLARMVLHAGSGVPTYSMHGDKLLSKGRLRGLVGQRKLPKSVAKLIEHTDLWFIKSHGCPDTSKALAMCPAIYLVRDGRDALVSHAHFLQGKRRFRGVLRGLIAGTFRRPNRKTPRPWGAAVLVWKARRAPTAYIRYEDLITRPYGTVQGALDQLGIPLKLQPHPLEPFGKLHKLNARFFRKGEVGSWKQEMPDKLHELFWQRHGDGMVAYGYTREGLGGT